MVSGEDEKKETEPMGLDGGEEERSEVELLRREVEEMKDRWLRAAADLENYKKRSARDREREIEVARDGVVLRLLDVLDDLERALDQDEGEGGLREGVVLIRQKFLAVLSEFGIRPYSSVGEEFDPEIHDALQRIPASETPEGHVAAEIRKGYRSDGRILRPALVVVASPPEKAEEEVEEDLDEKE
jgi:molecular chaperone GrpE